MEDEDKQKMEECIKEELESLERHFKKILSEDEYGRIVKIVGLASKSSYMSGFAEALLKAEKILSKNNSYATNKF